MDIPALIFLGVFSFIAVIVFLRLVFRVGRFMRHQTAQTELLSEIAKKQGVSVTIVDTITSYTK